MYEEYNKFLRSVHDKGEQEWRQHIDDRMGQIAEERTALLNHREGESLSYDDMSDIYMQVMGEMRAKNNMSLNTRSKNGEINDYLEVRRPFGAAQ